MKGRHAVRIGLLAFVAVSVAYLVAGDFGSEAPPAPATGPDSTAPAASRVIAYYFHATMRCPTCLAIEKGARTAIESAFTQQLASGALEFRSVNMEEPENEHFVKEFGLTASSLVLVRESAGRVSNWTNLERVWDLVGDDPSFNAYVVGSARDFLAAS